MTIEMVLARIEDEIKKAGSMRALAEQWGISAAYLCLIRLKRRNPGRSVLKHLNLSVTRIYSVDYQPIRTRAQS